MQYTIGSAKNLETLDDEKYGEFLIFRDKVDLSEEHFRIESDANGTFWLHSLVSKIKYKLILNVILM